MDAYPRTDHPPDGWRNSAPGEGVPVGGDGGPAADAPLAAVVGGVRRPRASAASTAAYVRGYLYLVASNVGAKGAGLVRELVVAALFGTSPGLGLYLLLKSGVEAASVSASGVFQLTLVPRLVRLAPAGAADDRRLLADALRVGAAAAGLSGVALSVAVVLTGERLSDAFGLVVVLSLSLGFLLVGVVGLIGLQAKGAFGRMSGVYLLTGLLMAALVYPLGRMFGVMGLALTWLVSVEVQAVVVWLPVLRALPARPRPRLRPLLRASDFRPSVLVAGNQLVLCLLVVKVLASLEGLEAVAVVNYALVLSSLFVTTIARNLSAVVLKAAADGLTWRRWLQALALQIAASVVVYLALLLYGEAAVRLLFERGAFASEATGAVHRFVLRVFPPLVLVGTLDLLVAYVNGRGLAVARRLYGAIAAALLASAAGAWALARWGPADVSAPLAFAYAFGGSGLALALVLVAPDIRRRQV